MRWPRGRHGVRRLALPLALSLVALQLLGFLGNAAHFATVVHVPCTHAGEFVHAGAAHPGEPAGDDRRTVAGGGAADPDHHEALHCVLTPHLRAGSWTSDRDGRAAPLAPEAATTFLPVPATLAVPGPVPLRGAPKHSPPA
jgi:hypothetical protein